MTIDVHIDHRIHEYRFAFVAVVNNGVNKLHFGMFQSFYIDFYVYFFLDKIEISFLAALPGCDL